ncbi:hypothetical protein ABZU94_29880 [Streptomyces mirabilis]|uniref:hypothetical protein n=1 Tax=Streptomyces sp. NPDC005388 TaxID=3156717 RepID=UPI0033A6BEAA
MSETTRPDDSNPERLYVQRASERARHELILDNIRGHLEEQPTPVAVLSAVRRWINDVIAVGDEVAKVKRRNPG